MKIVINKCFGGFSLSVKAEDRYLELKGHERFWYANPQQFWSEQEGYFNAPYKKVTFEEAQASENKFMFGPRVLTEDAGEQATVLNVEFYYSGDIKRDDPLLVQVVEELGEEASARFAALEVVEIPDDVDWEIVEYDGMEHIAETHRTWR